MKKILLLTQNFPPIEGGSGRWFWELYSRLPAENIVIVTHNEPSAELVDESLQATVIRMPLYSPEWGIKSMTGLRFYWRNVRALNALVKVHNIDEVHCGRVIHEGVIAWLSSFFGGKPYRCFVHGEDVETAATSREQALLVTQVCKKALNLICNSENSKQLTQNFGFAHSEKCTVIHPGADFDRFTIAEEDMAFKEQMGWKGKFVLLTVGRLQKRKGQDHLIKAMPEIVAAIPNCLYVVVGSGECKAELEALVDENGMQAHVQFLSGLDDQTLIRCYQQCDYFVLPNRTIGNDIEGFGMVLVEAQACGKPVIAGDSGGTKETMLLGETGHVIACDNPKSMAQHIVPILISPKKSAECYREYAKTHFSWETHLSKFIEMLER
ncbi:glycosyltransferase family 4 protein [Alteromonas sediminis]|uniref:Glycosyltransferase family 4 protein n=2 Tax=Alteromonas sediminis TaxID=2259342 RepID=A0A3N5XZD6_9ALTE|nr:glycosyltransferase family 4 protein [Alteromonas sediminis]